MYNNILIESLDSFGRGIAHINGKVIFVKNALPEEIVDIKILINKKRYSEAIVLKYIKLSPKRVKSICPYFNKCGGCHLLYYNYLDSIDFKYNKVKDLFIKNKINVKNIDVVANTNYLEYRNKISLKIINKKIGFYKDSTHELVEIDKCLIANSSINKVIKCYKLLNINNGELIIRVNSNNEILLIIKSSNNNYNIEIEKLKKEIKLVGIVYNNKVIYGNDFYYERINNKLFKISYDSFFQVNPYITSKLFNLVSDNIDQDSTVLDLYSGVGTLGIIASTKAKYVYSVEIVKNAVLNGNKNALLNKVNNIKFFLGDVSKIVNKLNVEFNTLIIDPPRCGLDKETIKFIKDKLC